MMRTAALRNRNRSTLSDVERAKYAVLARRYPPRPIESDEEHDAAVRAITPLGGRDGDRLSPGEDAYFRAVARFIQDYDERQVPWIGELGTPLERLKFIVQESGIHRRELSNLLGGASAVSMVLSGARSLSKAQIRRLADRFKLDPGYFF